MNRREFHRMLAGAVVAPKFLQREAQAQTESTAIQNSENGRFRFSVMLWALEANRKHSTEQCLEFAAHAGYQGVELVSEPARWSSTEAQRIRHKLHSLGLQVDSMAGLQIRLADPGFAGKLYSLLQTHIELARSFGCRQIILTSGNRIDGISLAQQHAACISNLRHVADLVTKHDVELVIEPIDQTEQPRYFLNSVAQGFDIVRSVNCPNIKVLYDFYHEQYQSGDLIVKLERNIDWVGLVHIADVPGRHEPGTGEINYRSIYRKLAELKYSRFIAMEYYPTGDPTESLKTQRLVALQAAKLIPEPYRVL